MPATPAAPVEPVADVAEPVASATPGSELGHGGGAALDLDADADGVLRWHDPRVPAEGVHWEPRGACADGVHLPVSMLLARMCPASLLSRAGPPAS